MLQMSCCCVDSTRDAAYGEGDGKICWSYDGRKHCDGDAANFVYPFEPG